MHDELLPKVEKAGTMEKAREVMTNMLERLKQSHFGIFPAGRLQRDGFARLARRQPRDRCAHHRQQGRGLSVDPGSPAAVRGVKPGWLITRVDGKDVLPGIRKIQESFSKSTLLDIMLSRSVTSRLYGKSGQGRDG